MECILSIDRPESPGGRRWSLPLGKVLSWVRVASATGILPHKIATRRPRVRSTKGSPGGGTSEFVVVVDGDRKVSSSRGVYLD